MSGRAFSVMVGVIASLLDVAPPVAAQQARPNIVLIIGDDHGWPDSGFMPSPRTIGTNQGFLPINQVVQTPNLDALAAQGVTFRNAYSTASVCVPSLRTALSAAGLQPFQWMETRAALDALPQLSFPPGPLYYPRTEVEHFRTVPKELRHAGYKSWEAGKMWEGTFGQAGFTHGLATDHGEFLAPRGHLFGREGWDPALCGPTAAPGASCPALDPLRVFLDEVEGEPFFLWFAPMLPHTPFLDPQHPGPPLNPPQNFLDPYLALGLGSCTNLPWCCPSLNWYCNQLGYLANVSWLDAVIGELVDELDSRGLRDDTLLIYFSDNGWDWSANPPKGKLTLYDLGFRTPMIFNWPGHVPAGVSYDDLVSVTDVPRTVFDYAGVDPLPEQQGLSLRARVEGGPPVPRSEIIVRYEDDDGGHFLRTDTWRYLRFSADGHEELYQIDIDPFEVVDVAAQNPGLVAAFGAMVDQWEIDRQTPPARLEIAGRALDPVTTAPLVCSEVQLVGGPFPLISLVGQDGFFRFGPIDLASYQLQPSARITAVDWLGTPSPVPAAVPLGVSGHYLNVTATQTKAITTLTGAQIRGTLTTVSGAALPGVRIDVRGAIGCDSVRTQTVTQPDGSYRAENLPLTTYSITADSPPGYQDVAVTGVVVGAIDVFTRNLVAQPE
jgi:uncharacterized sulfatase